MKNLAMDTVKSETSFNSVIRTNVALLKLSGIILPDKKTIPKIILSYCLTFVSLIFLVTYTSVYTYDFVIHSAYIESMIESFALIIAFFGGLIRFIISYNSRETVRNMLIAMEKLWTGLNTEERRSVELLIKKTTNLTYLFISQCVITIFFYTITPLIVNSHDDNENATKILPYAFFTEVDRSPYYEILYFLQVISILNISLACVGMDMIGPFFTTMVCGHFRVIQTRFHELGRRVEARRNNAIVKNSDHQTNKNNFAVVKNPGIEIWENDSFESLLVISSELRACVNYHKIILAISTDIEKLTNIIFLTQLIGSTYILSTVGFKLSGNDQDKYKYSSQILIGLVQLVSCNWPPDLLLTESQAVADAAYLTAWYQWPIELRKSIHIVILRAQKPIQLTAGKFVNLSLETFSSMVVSAISFFTVLRSFN